MAGISKKFKLYLDIYLTFLKLGSVSFGGGYAIICLMEREVVEVKKWISKEKIVDIFAVSQSLPGAIALNSSAFVGFSIAGIPGALIALLGNLTSPVIIIILLSIIYSKVRDLPAIRAAFMGIYPTIVALIAFAAVKIGKTAIEDAPTLVIMLLSFILSVFFNVSPILLILFGAVLGILLSQLKKGLQKKRGDR